MIKYDLHLLGWYAFQQLCSTITREILGQTVESFLDSNDAGKDGAFSGTWKANNNEDIAGQFVIQCKFTNRPNKNLGLSDVKEEFDKIKKLVTAGRCDAYILMTNAGVSGQFNSAFKEKLKKLGVKSSLTLGSTWICSQIHESQRLRAMVPRIYGLGDLSQIMDERAYAQAKQLLASMRDDLSKIVITSAYHKAVKAISTHGFVLIIGEPAAGKTTMASLLAMAAVDKHQLSPAKLNTPQSVTRHWNPDDPKQFFWIDDAFGVTQYESDLAKSWNHILPEVKTMISKGVQIVMTSRDYIYKRARQDLKEGAFPLFNESQVVIDVHKLSLLEKEQILYNHLKLGRQSKNFLQQVKPHLPKIAAQDRFIPETARRLADPAFTKELYLSWYSLMDFVDKQESFLEEVIRGLDKHSQAALALLYMNNGNLNNPVDFKPNEIAAIRRIGSAEGGCIEALEAMKDSLVQYTFIEDNSIWRFKHPTIGDAYSNIISKSPNLLEIYLKGTDFEKVIEQITCGDIGLEKAIVVPKSMFPEILIKLQAFKKSEAYKTEHLSIWRAKDKTLTFLSRRASKDFQSLYIEADSDLIDDIIRPSLSFSYSPEIDLVIKLYENGLLSEAKRREFTEYIGHFTITGEDMRLLDDANLQSVFTGTELEAVIKIVKESLIPNLTKVRQKHELEFRQYSSRTAEEHMEDLAERLNVLTKQFQEDETVLLVIKKQLTEMETWVSENSEDEAEKRPERIIDSMEDHNIIESSRSIFDDIDTDYE